MECLRRKTIAEKDHNIPESQQLHSTRALVSGLLQIPLPLQLCCMLHTACCAAVVATGTATVPPTVELHFLGAHMHRITHCRPLWECGCCKDIGQWWWRGSRRMDTRTPSHPDSQKRGKQQRRRDGGSWEWKILGACHKTGQPTGRNTRPWLFVVSEVKQMASTAAVGYFSSTRRIFPALLARTGITKD